MLLAACCTLSQGLLIPLQEGIDGGGFKIITSEPGYLYIQFESLQSGFIDDVEFSANPNGDGILWRYVPAVLGSECRNYSVVCNLW